MDDLCNWLAALRLRTPQATVIFVATHKDKCVPGNRLTNALAWLQRSKSIEETMAEVERSLIEKHEEWKRYRREGPPNAFTDGDLTLEAGIHLVSSSPSSPANGLLELEERLQKCGENTRSWIPPSWNLALTVLEASRSGIDPMTAAVCHVTNAAHPEPIPANKRAWMSMKEIRDSWIRVQDYPGLPRDYRSDDPSFALKRAMDLR